MSLGNLWFFAALTAMITLPAARKPEGEFDKTDTRRADLPKIERPLAAAVPSRNPKDLGPGKLLVASRELGDPNFAKTVILLVHYDAQGVVGLMLNRRTGLPVSQVLAQLDAAKDRSDPVYLGGPLETPTVFALFESREKLETAEHVFGGIYWITAKTAMEKAISSRPNPGDFRVYLGYAGWTADQLRNEVRLGGWFIFQADKPTVFTTNPDSLWRDMIRRTELTVAERAASEPYRISSVN